MTRMNRWFGVVGAVALSACVAEPDLPSSQQAARAAPPKFSERVLCVRDACMLTYATDSDGDGVADIDEAFARTDALNPRSRPSDWKLISLAARGVLPS